MATLKSLSDSELTLRPKSIEEAGNPTWVASLLTFYHKGKLLKSATVSLTIEDLQEIERSIIRASSEAKGFSVVTSDDNFIIGGHGLDSPDDVVLWFWLGEPYQLMTGYRFIVKRSALNQFAIDLRAEILQIPAMT